MSRVRGVSREKAMSVGITGRARLIAQDESYAVYSYSGRNINMTGIEEKYDELSDGKFRIKKSSLEEPEIHRKYSKYHRKTVTKIITHCCDTQKKISDGDIVIEKPCKYECCRYGEENYIAHRLLIHICTEYQSSGKLPERTGFVQ